MDEVQALYSGGLTHLAQGSSLLQAGRLQDAIGEFESAVRQNPRLIAAHVNLIALYGRMRDTPKAQQHFRIASALDPGSVEAYYNWGILLRDQDRSAEAAEIFQKVLDLNPNHSNTHVQLALLLEKAGQSEQAAKHYDLALQASPDDRQAHFLYAENLARKGQLEAAIAHLQETIAVEDERTPVCMYALATVYDRTGNRERAVYFMRQALDRAASLDLRDLVATIRGNLNRLSAGTSSR
jgi:tetratricopeptide (TPR) repeat protein